MSIRNSDSYKSVNSASSFKSSYSSGKSSNNSSGKRLKVRRSKVKYSKEEILERKRRAVRKVKGARTASVIAINNHIAAFSQDNEEKNVESDSSLESEGEDFVDEWITCDSNIIHMLTTGNERASEFRVALSKFRKNYPAGEYSISKFADNVGNSLLHLAATSGKCELAKVLIDEYAFDVNVTKDLVLSTPLHNASHEKMAELLLDRGGNPCALRHDGLDVIGYAIKTKRKAVIRVFKSRGYSVPDQENDQDQNQGDGGKEATDKSNEFKNVNFALAFMTGGTEREMYVARMSEMGIKPPKKLTEEEYQALKSKKKKQKQKTSLDKKPTQKDPKKSSKKMSSLVDAGDLWSAPASKKPSKPSTNATSERKEEGQKTKEEGQKTPEEGQKTKTGGCTVS